MRKNIRFILSAVFMCSVLPWTGRSVSAEAVSAPSLLEASDAQEQMLDEGKIPELQEQASDEGKIPELQKQTPDEGKIPELQERMSDEEEFQEFQEETPNAEEDWERAGISDNAFKEAGGIPIDEAHFPDSNFREYLTLSSFDKDKDGILSEQEIKNVTSIKCSKSRSDQGGQSWGKIESLEGIEYFTEITTLICDGNGLTTLDVSQNKELVYFSCSNNRLESLIIGDKTQLARIYCDENQLEELDLTGVPGLCQLNCSRNKLTDLQIGCLPMVLDIHCENNLLTYLDLSGIDSLDKLYCNDNKLSSLNLGNSNVEILECQNNLLTELDLSNSPAARYVNCENNMLRSLDLSGNFIKGGDDSDDRLSTLRCSDNRLESIKFAKNNDLWILSCENNRLRSLDVKNMRDLGRLVCYGNNIRALDVSRTPTLGYLRTDPGTKVVYTSAPKLASLKRDQKKATIAWDHDANLLDGFFIYRKVGKGGWKKVGEIRKNHGKGRYSYVDKYTGKGSVTYTVRAFRSMRPGIDDETYEDHKGDYDKKGLCAAAVPSAPKNFRAAAGSGRTKLTWKKISGASGYHIYRKDPKSAKWKKIADVKPKKASYTDKKVKKGKTYSYRVRAYKKGTGKNKNVIANGVFSVIKKAKIR